MARTFTDYINNPKYIVESRGFNTAAYAGKIAVLFVLTTVGLTISGFKYNSFNDLLSIAYWLSVAVTLIEQLWANDSSYKYGLFLFASINDDMKKANAKSDIIIYGAIDEATGLPLVDEKTKKPLVTPITDTSKIKYADIAVKKISKKEKINHVSKQVQELIDFFENKLEHFKVGKKKRWFFPRAIKVKKFIGKPFWKKESAIAYCKQKITEGKKLINDKKKILSMPNNQIKGYNELDINDLISNQDQAINSNESQYFMRSRKKARTKSVLTKMISKMILATVGLGLMFGAIDTVDSKTIMTIVILILIQLYGGLNEARKHIKSYEVVNSQRRAKVLQIAYNMIPEIEKEEKEKAEAAQKKLEAFRAELAKQQVKLLTTKDEWKNDTYTTDILPTNLKKQFANLLST